MYSDKYYIALEEDEKRLLICCLNQLRTKQIKLGKDSLPVDEVLLKNAKAKKRKFRIIEREA